MSKANSPTYLMGLEDGALDEALIKSCPPEYPTHYAPPVPAHPWMYRRGYFAPEAPGAPPGADGCYTGLAHTCGPYCHPEDDE